MVGFSAGGDGDDDIVEIEKKETIDFVNRKKVDPRGSFFINKTDDKGVGLDGAIFELVNDRTNQTTRLDSSVNGRFTFTNLDPGTYTLREVKAPEGFKKADTLWRVVVDSQGKVFISEMGDFGPAPDLGGEDVSSRVVFINPSMRFIDSNGDGKITVNTGENEIHALLSLSIPGRVNPGDYFVLEESDSLHYNMLQPDKLVYPPIYTEDDRLLASPVIAEDFNIEKGTNKKVYYVFTDVVEGLENVKTNLSLTRSVNINHVVGSGTWNFFEKIGPNKLEESFGVIFNPPKRNNHLSIASNFYYTNDQDGRYTQIAQINPDGKYLPGESIISFNTGIYNNDFPLADINAEKSKISVYKIKPGMETQAVIFDKDRLELVDPSQYQLEFYTMDNKTRSGVDIKINGINSDKYLVRIDSEMAFPAKGDARATSLVQWAILANNGYSQGDGNAIGTQLSEGSGTGSYEPPTLQLANYPIVEGSFTINKIARDKGGDSPLAGAEFTLTDTKDGSIVRQGRSNEQGELSFVQLKPGRYELKETGVPEGYSEPAKTWIVIVGENGETSIFEKTSNGELSAERVDQLVNNKPNLEVINTKEDLSFTIIKKDEDDPEKLLQGAEFKLSGPNGYEKVLTSGEDGRLSFTELIPGYYTLEEIKAPEGYEKQKESLNFIVADDGEIYNSESISYLIHNSGTTKMFTRDVYYWNSVRTYNWIGFYEELSEGATEDSFYLDLNYYPQNGFNVNANWIVNFNSEDFEIIPDMYSAQFYNPNTGQFSRIINTGASLEGGFFRFTIKPKNIQGSRNTSPIISSSFDGTRIEERYHPTLEASMTEKLEGLENVNGKLEYTVTNKLREVEFIKLGGEYNSEGVFTGEALAGAEFELFKENDQGEFEKVDTNGMTSDPNGKIISDKEGKISLRKLGPGTYKLVETKIPTGYVAAKNSDKFFTIKEDGSITVKDQDGNDQAYNEETKTIINPKAKRHDFTVKKKDENGNPLAGVSFDLYDIDGKLVGQKSTDQDGLIVFKDLPTGYYTLKETSTKAGYILAEDVEVILAENFEIPENPNPKDISDLMDFEVMDWGTERGSQVSEALPNSAGSLYVLDHFVIPDDAKGGDYFDLKLSDQVDMLGVRQFTNGNKMTVDMLGGMGVVAKGVYDEASKTIRFTFTDYVDSFSGVEADLRLSVFVDEVEVPFNANINLTQTVGDKSDTKPYTVNYEEHFGTYGYASVGSHIDYNLEEKTFTAYIYVNPRMANFNTGTLTIQPFKDNPSDSAAYFTQADINNIKVWRVPYLNGYGPYNDPRMPRSWGVKEELLTNPIYVERESWNSFNPRSPINLYFGNEFSYYNRAAVVRIDGHFDDSVDTINFKAIFEAYNNDYDWWSANYFNYIKRYENEGNAEGTLEYELKNYPNRIEYTKIEGAIVGKAQDPVPDPGENPDSGPGQDQGQRPPFRPVGAENEYKVLQGAEFQLEYRPNAGADWTDYGGPVSSDEFGKFSWAKLPDGNYQVLETKAPEGYVRPDGPVSSFDVENGEIKNILNSTSFIPNEKIPMYFYLDKVSRINEELVSIENGNLELKLSAPEGKSFPEDLQAGQILEESQAYEITEVSEDKKTITLKIDLSKAYQDFGHGQRGIKINVPSSWPSGDYVLEESKAPAGYMVTDEKFILSVDQDGRNISQKLVGEDGTEELIPLYKESEGELILGLLKIENKKTRYPDTGGPGTVLFTGLGAALMVLAYLGYRRKKVIG